MKKTNEMISVRKDILEDLYKAIDEYTLQIFSLPAEDWRFGNVMELRDELEVGHRYEEKYVSEKSF